MASEALLNKVRELAERYSVDCFSCNSIEFITGSNINLKEFAKKFPWRKLTKDDQINDDFIEAFVSHLDWYAISWVGKLSESFIVKYSDKLNWSMISQHQELSEQFMEKHHNKIDWSKVVSGQVLTEDFIIRHKDKFPSTHALFVFQKLSATFKDRYFQRSY